MIKNRKYGDEVTMSIIEKKVKKLILVGAAATFLMVLTGCAPEVGSDKWCKNMGEKNKSDWTVNEATEYAKSCLLK